MLNSGQILQDRYQLQQRLGRTAAGRQTWLALDLQSNESVTVKLLAFSPEMQWEELKLFEREAQVLQSLQHPRIPRYRDYFSLDRETTGLPWFGLVQDYISGFSLQDLLEKGQRFTKDRVKNIAIDLLEILIYLHSLNPPVLHRDIKPSNLILGEDERVYLVDFGAVQSQAAVTGVTFTVVGSSGYAPLEQFLGRAVPASDLYALGATLIHLLTGTSPADLPQKDSRIQFSHLVSLSPSLVGWIERLIEVGLEKRFSSAQEALCVLQSGQSQISERSFANGKAIPKPFLSCIQIIKSQAKLEVYITLQLMRNPIKSLAILVFFWMIILPIFVHNLFISGMSSKPIYFIFFAMVTILTCQAVGSGNQVIFHKGIFELKYQFFGWTYWKRAGKINAILGVFLQSSHCGEYKIKLRSKNGYLGPKSYLLAEGLKERESAWLAQEIQDWLAHR